MTSKEIKYNLHYDDVRRDVLRQSTKTVVIFDKQFPSSKCYLNTVCIEMDWGSYISHSLLNICFASISSPAQHFL